MKSPNLGQIPGYNEDWAVFLEKRQGHRMTFEDAIGAAILGIDTLWGGDVMCASGTGRFIADSWFGDAELPAAYTDPSAAGVRATGGVGAKQPDAAAIDEYLRRIDIPAAIADVRSAARDFGELRGEYLAGLALCFETMWDLAMEMLDRGAAVPYARCVEASTGALPEPSDPAAHRDRLAELLAVPASDLPRLLEASDEWRKQHRIPMASVGLLGAAVISHFDELSLHHLLPHLPLELHEVPRANIEFLPIRDAWFSGSMNYLGRKRRADGSPQ
jgi:hypothetical protein